MPAVISDKPFEHKCIHCGTPPTNPRKRSLTDKRTGDRKFGGEYFACRCISLTLGIDGKKFHLNQTDAPKAPDLV